MALSPSYTVRIGGAGWWLTPLDGEREGVSTERCVGGRYGFVVYMDPTVTDIACAGLNGMRMGERTLTVRRATEVIFLFRGLEL